MKVKVFSAAGGNSTAIFFDTSCQRSDYEMLNSLIQKAYSKVEQVGFYEEDDGVPRLQMAGGEFCGNATRSFACFLSEMNSQKSEFEFQVSGFDKLVTAQVKQLGNDTFNCEAKFDGLAGKITEKKLDGKQVLVVDLGGIIHILVNENDFPINKKTIKEDMQKIKDSLDVDCGAVGVLWVREEDNNVFMRPVVWVKAIDTCFDETSCGSGTIAIALARNKDVSVIQPSKKTIDVRFEDGSMVLSSLMKKTITL